eukprot:362595-Chlamydomonas_euryale.AAC.3
MHVVIALQTLSGLVWHKRGDFSRNCGRLNSWTAAATVLHVLVPARSDGGANRCGSISCTSTAGLKGAEGLGDRAHRAFHVGDGRCPRMGAPCSSTTNSAV